MFKVILTKDIKKVENRKGIIYSIYCNKNDNLYHFHDINLVPCNIKDLPRPSDSDVVCIPYLDANIFMSLLWMKGRCNLNQLSMSKLEMLYKGEEEDKLSDENFFMKGMVEIVENVGFPKALETPQDVTEFISKIENNINIFDVIETGKEIMIRFRASNL